MSKLDAWEKVLATQLPATVVRRMHSVAELCARTKNVESAGRLLCLSLDFGALPREWVDRVDEALQTHKDAPSGHHDAPGLIDSASQLEDLTQRHRLEAVSILLSNGSQPPWPPVAVWLSRGIENMAAALAAPLVNACPFELGARVLAWDRNYLTYHNGSVVGMEGFELQSPCRRRLGCSHEAEIGHLSCDSPRYTTVGTFVT